ncbi:GNAT family N-acetyltransferase [Sphingobacterium sp. T2]|uniref:GNAT family N-acetyltransferase n=1 Tax=Sphingobacterium sp. T2 TaxID=1590596 RepID=UPI00057BCA64|nr:GNAT family N-acetyltransferase [Sphingobacterium sp. T2]
MESIIITEVRPDEIQDLQRICKLTFSETFSASNSENDMNNYLSENFSLEKITTEFNDKNSLFYFAKEGANILGYLKLNFGDAQTELRDPKALEIERIYVLKEFHGKKVGQLLFEKALKIAEEKKVDYVWLGVWEENLRAINFYKKNGFEEFDKHIFKLGNDEQTDIMMKLKLTN